MNIPFSSLLVFFLPLSLSDGLLPFSSHLGPGDGEERTAVACRLAVEPIRRGDERTTTA
jgi:hypothetical protein